MNINREQYLNELVNKKDNGRVKIMAIFNSVVEIYKSLIKEYHTSTLMALA